MVFNPHNPGAFANQHGAILLCNDIEKKERIELSRMRGVKKIKIGVEIKMNVKRGEGERRVKRQTEGEKGTKE